MKCRQHGPSGSGKQIAVQKDPPDIGMTINLGNVIVQLSGELHIETSSSELRPDVLIEVAEKRSSAPSAFGRSIGALPRPR
jgi:hypothetical protein